MLNITKITNNKTEILLKNIFPNVCWNRFDLRYGDDYDLYQINPASNKTEFVAAHCDDCVITVSLYLRELESGVFNDFAKYMFEIYPHAKTLFVMHTYTPIKTIEPGVHWHIDLPNTIEEFDSTLSHRVRYNTKWYPKKIRENVGEYTIKYMTANDCPDEIVSLYFKWKNQTHGTDYCLTPREYLKKFCVTGAYVMQTESEVLAIGFISETGENVFFENFSYNQEYAKYSVGMVLLHYIIDDLIKRGKKKFFLLGGNLEYKRHFNGIATTTYTGTLYREYFIYPKYLAWLAKITPKFLQKIVILFLPHTRDKRSFSALVKQ